MFKRLAKLSASVALAAALSSAAFAEVVLHRGNGSEPQTLDQAHTSIDVEANILKDLYEGLTVYDAGGNIIPGCAESWTVSDDGLVYTFKIRDDAKWSNGDPVTADDFVFSFRRIENPKEAAGYANILYPIKNAEAINTPKEGASRSLSISSASRPSTPRRWRSRVERPTPYFLTLMAHQTALPFHKASVEKLGADFVKPGNMVSNGAFMLTENVANDHITVVKNPNYWDAANVKLDKVIFYPTEDQAAAVRRFEAGELDLNYYFPTDQLTFLTREVRRGRGPHPAGARRPTITRSTRASRRSTTCACARRCRWRSTATSSARRSSPARSCRSTASCRRASRATRRPCRTSPAMSQLDREDKAKELLKEAGYGEGGKPLNIEIRYNTNDNHKKVATAVADMWKGLGATVTITNSDTKSHYAYLQEGGKFNAARAGWSADYPDPENFLAMYISTNKTFNYGHYNNPEYDELMKKSYEERDPGQALPDPA